MKKQIILFTFFLIALYTLCSCIRSSDTSSNTSDDISKSSEAISNDIESSKISQDESREYSESLDNCSADYEDSSEPNASDTLQISENRWILCLANILLSHAKTKKT